MSERQGVSYRWDARRWAQLGESPALDHLRHLAAPTGAQSFLGFSGVSLKLSKVTFAGLVDVVNAATPTMPSPRKRTGNSCGPSLRDSGCHALPSALMEQLSWSPRRSILR